MGVFSFRSVLALVLEFVIIKHEVVHPIENVKNKENCRKADARDYVDALAALSVPREIATEICAALSAH